VTSLAVTSIVIRTQTRIAGWFDDESGGSLIEYALLVAFIAVACIFAITQIGEKTLSNTGSIIEQGGFDADVTGG
jgi:Flp pilus assembly pilin Flp